MEILLDEVSDNALVPHDDKPSWPEDTVHFKEQVFRTATSFVKVGEDCPCVEKIICSRIGREGFTPAETLLYFSKK
jgi:hypothetical protein